MTDLTTTIAPKSDQLNADDLIAGPRTIKVTGVRLLGEEQPVAIEYEGGQGRPYKPCKSMRRVMVQLWGGDGREYLGRSMTIYRDPEVAFGGSQVGGIRISHMSNIDGEKKLSLTASRGHRKPYIVRPLKDAPPKQDKPLTPPDFDPHAFAAEVSAHCASATNAGALKEWANSPDVMAKRSAVKKADEALAGTIRGVIADRIGVLAAGGMFDAY